MIEDKGRQIERAILEVVKFSEGGLNYHTLNDVYPLPETVEIINDSEWLSKKIEEKVKSG